MTTPVFTKKGILELFNKLDKALAEKNIKGELFLVGGAVMTLVYKARASTKDIDAFFEPKSKIRNIAKEIAEREGLKENWLNDAVKGYLSQSGNFDTYLELENLKVNVASPEYLLAMKCLAMRLGKEFHDEDDIRFLLRYLNIEKYNDAIEIINRYYPKERFPQKTLYALEEILSKK